MNVAILPCEVTNETSDRGNEEYIRSSCLAASSMKPTGVLELE